MARDKKGFNIGRTTKIRYESPSRSWSIKVPKTKPGRLDYCEQKISPSPDNGVLANLARKIPNADVFAFYKSAYNRWIKALSKYPDYAGTSTIDNIPYREYYFKSCQSITGAWKVSYRDDGTRDFGIDTENTQPDTTFNGGNYGTGGINTGGNGGYNSTYYSCESFPVIILEDGTEIDEGLEQDTNVTCYEQQIVCANGGCSPGRIYIPYDGVSSDANAAQGRITYPQGEDSETTGFVYQISGNNLSFTLEEDTTNPVAECAGNCDLSTDYGTGQGAAVIKWGDDKSFSTTDLPLTFEIEPVTSSTSYQHTWRVPEGCTEITEFNTSDPVGGYSLDKIAEEIDSSGSAAEGVEYCLIPQKSKLSWDINGGTVTKTTLDAPISYVLGTGATEVQIDWGGGDIEIIPGSSWTTNSIQTLTPCQAAGNPVLQRSYYPDGGTYSALLGATPLSGDIGVDSIGWLLSVAACLGAFNRGVFSLLPVSCDGFCYDSVSTSGGVVLSGTDPIQTVTVGSQKVWRQQASPPTITLLTSQYSVIVSDANGEIGTFLYEEEPTNFTYQCISETTNGWKLNFQPQNVSIDFGLECKPTNIVINQKTETDCCFTRSVSGGKTKWIDVSGIQNVIPGAGTPNPTDIDCSVLGAYSACSLPDFTQVGFADLGGGVYQSLVKSDNEVVTDTCTAKSKLSIFANGSLVKEEIVCGAESDLLDTLSITSADQITYTLTIFVDGVQSDQLVYEDYDPTSNAELFYIEQFPYCNVLSTDDEGNTTQYYLSDDVRYVCRTRIGGEIDIDNGPYTVQVIDNGDGTYTVLILDANGNIVSSETYGTQPSVNGSNPNSPVQIDTTNQEPYLTCTCPDHDRKIYYYDQSKQDEGYISDWSAANGAGAPNILGTRCCKHVFSVLNQLGVADKYIPEDFPTDPVPEKYLVPGMIGDDAIKALKPNDINRL